MRKKSFLLILKANGVLWEFTIAFLALVKYLLVMKGKKIK